jgi:hypothetical protein
MTFLACVSSEFECRHTLKLLCLTSFAMYVKYVYTVPTLLHTIFLTYCIQKY